MARVHFVQSAMKNYPGTDIKKGDSYYWWRFYRQPKRMSKVRPKPSQTTPNEAVSQVLALAEELESWGEVEWTVDDRDELVSQLETIRDDEQDKFDNLPEGFQMGDTGQQIEEHINTIDQWIDELNEIDFEEEPEEGSATPLEQALATIPSF